MPSTVETIEEKKKNYSQELAAYTLQQWEIFHSQSKHAQALAEQQRHNRSSPQNSDGSRGGQKSPRRTQIGKILRKWVKDR